MILLDLKHYIRQHQCVSLTDIQVHFDLSKEAALGLLHPLLQQGHVLKISPPSCYQTTTCQTHCTPSSTPYFQWYDTPKKPIKIPVQTI